MSAATPVVGQATPFSAASEFNTLQFNIMAALLKMQTLSIVEVISCTNDGNVAAQGTVQVRVLVNILTGNGTSIPHGVISNVPYCRLQGGTNAHILDPVAGDVGLCCFASRDITAVKNAKGAANPSSARIFDWADAIYIGGILNGVPTQYVQFDASGITIVSPVAVTITAPVVNVNASTSATVTSPDITLDGAVTITGTLDVSGASTLAATTAQGTNVHTHTHGGVQSGGSDTGPPL